MKKQIVRPGRTVQEKVRKPIPVTGLKIGMNVIELDRPWLETPFILQGFIINSMEDIDELSKYCEYVYIEQSEDGWLEAEERSASKKPKATGINYSNSTSNKQEFNNANIAYTAARQITRSFMDDVRLGKGIDIKNVEATVSECVKSILRNPDTMMWMSKIRKKDEYTAEHSLNVGMLAITFGRHLGASEEDLNKLGIAGMLHDVGKMRTPIEVLNKEGQLDVNEFDIMKHHAQHGRDILMAHKKVHHSSVDVAYTHHEAIDGTGYPRKIKGSGITDFTRMVTLCDVYDAITSDRIYKTGRSSLEAMKILHQNRNSKYDDRLVSHFIECIGLYPPGCIVELRSGEAGIVISTNYRNRHLPKVLVLRDQKKMPQSERIFDLERIAKSDNNANLIKTVLPNGSLGIRIEEYIKKGLTID
jgi:HD-GYP domain-containing protein (c-di-GMP phosphodiesterase class II)